MAMKRSIIIAALLAWACIAQAGVIRSININLSLDREGNAHITEIWDLDADEGTEWYLVRENLDGMSVRDFRVSEGGVQFEDVEVIIQLCPCKRSHLLPLSSVM